MEELLKPCRQCGKKPKVNLSCGGFDIYYGIDCECGNNNRHHYSAIAGRVIPMNEATPGSPPRNRQDAIDEWNKENTTAQR